MLPEAHRQRCDAREQVPVYCQRVPQPLPFTAPWLLAPMEGVTESCFRNLVFERNSAESLGGAFTEFVPVTTHPLRAGHLRRALLPPGSDAGSPPGWAHASANRPVGLQLIGSNLDCLAATASNAAAAGVQLLDINFGCPTKGTLHTCAGSALLRDPNRIELIIKTVVQSAAPIPVTAKLRAGFDDDTTLETLAKSVEAAGAQMLTLHCRTRAEGYSRNVNWTRIARAVRTVQIPVCGNGGVASHSDLERMRQETGCTYVMVGRAALADPWIFSNHQPDNTEAANFLLSYAERLVRNASFTMIGAASRVKQLMHFWTAGGLFKHSGSNALRAEPSVLFANIAAAGNVNLNDYPLLKSEKMKARHSEIRRQLDSWSEQEK